MGVAKAGHGVDGKPDSSSVTACSQGSTTGIGRWGYEGECNRFQRNAETDLVIGDSGNGGGKGNV